MDIEIVKILSKQKFKKEDLIVLLRAKGEEQKLLFEKSQEIQLKYVGKKVFFRGLIEFSNVCSKDCLYCGIRKSNTYVDRYHIDDEAIVGAAKFAWDKKYASLVLQGGERNDSQFVDRIDDLLQKIQKETKGELGITLSVGEQTEETYQRWLKSGARRYLLRIESSNKELYEKIHPKDSLHKFDQRIQCLKTLQSAGYQTGTGVMIGLPNQTFENLANDLLFMKDLDIDMCGMGPYLEHEQTPLYTQKDLLWTKEERLSVTFNMIAILRIIMKDINIAAATALQAIDPLGREKALKIGANVIMPNITPTFHRKDYQLYKNKPCTDEGAEDCTNCMDMRVSMADREIGFGEWGDSKHYLNRRNQA